MIAKFIDKLMQDPRTPSSGLAFYINIADFKRRNHHLGYLRCNQDIEELTRLVEDFARRFDGSGARVDGDGWLLLLPEEATRLQIQALVDSYIKMKPIEIGWKCEAVDSKGNKSTERVFMQAQITRSVRCGYREFKKENSNFEDLPQSTCFMEVGLVTRVEKDLQETDISKRWRCVDTNEPDHFCINCKSPIIEWKDLGWGTCSNCGSELNFISL